MPFGKKQLLTAQAVGKACEGQQWRPAFPSDRRNEWLGQWLEGRERGPKGDDALGKFFADRPWNCSHAEALSLWHDSHPSVPCSSREFAKKWLNFVLCSTLFRKPCFRISVPAQAKIYFFL